MTYLRATLETAVEHLIAALDAIDGDPDLENSFDREAEHDGREPENGW